MPECGGRICGRIVQVNANQPTPLPPSVGKIACRRKTEQFINSGATRCRIVPTVGKAGQREKAGAGHPATYFRPPGGINVFTRRSLFLAGFVALLGPAALYAQGPAYQIVLRSRRAEVTPTRTKD